MFTKPLEVIKNVINKTSKNQSQLSVGKHVGWKEVFCVLVLISLMHFDERGGLFDNFADVNTRHQF